MIADQQSTTLAQRFISQPQILCSGKQAISSAFLCPPSSAAIDSLRMAYASLPVRNCQIQRSYRLPGLGITGAGMPFPPTAAVAKKNPLGDYPLLASFTSQYTLCHELGQGGYGIVFLAIRQRDHMPVAVKFITKSKVPSRAWVHDPHMGSIPIEILILSRVRHPVIIGFIDVFQDEHFFYLVTEIHGKPWGRARSSSAVQRRDLFECIEHQGRLSERIAKKIFCQLIDCVSHLYRLSLFHRDIKDENILVDENYNIKLVDFGSAIHLTRQQRAHNQGKCLDRFYGTITCAAPEILLCHPYDPEAAEVWTLGVLLYTMLTGRIPFKTKNDVIQQPVPFEYLTGCSVKCIQLLDGMLAKPTQQRFTLNRIRSHPWLRT